MRWFFLLLVTVNLAYFSWYMLGESSPGAELVPLKNVEPVVMLQERNAEAELANAQNNDVESDDLEGNDVQSNDSAAQPAAKSEQAPLQQEEQQQALVADKLVTNKLVADKKVASKTAAIPAAIPAVKAPVKKPATAVAAAPTVSARADRAIATVRSEKPATGDENCYTLGPFASLDTLRGLTRDISDSIVSADFRGEELELLSTYWVLLKPVASFDLAKAETVRLKSKKINDFFIIRDGEFKHGVSLGRFRNKASAYGLARKVTSLGFDVLVEPIYKTSTQYWLDYQLSPDATIPKAVFDKYIDKNNSDFTRKSLVCP